MTTFSKKKLIHTNKNKNKRSEPNILPPGFNADLRVRHRCLGSVMVRVEKLGDGIPR